MTDENKAEEYAGEKCKECYMCDYADNERPEINPYEVCPWYTKRKEGYLDGFAEGRKELEKENAESKQIIYKLVNAFNDYECAGPEQEQENTWEILRDLMHEELFKLTTRNK